MELPETLAQLISAARDSLRQGHAVSAAAQAKNAEAFVETIRSYVVPTPELESKFAAVVEQIRAYGAVGGDPYRLRRRSRDWAEQSKQLALLEIERLAEELERAKPSEDAIALGLDWW